MRWEAPTWQIHEAGSIHSGKYMAPTLASGSSESGPQPVLLHLGPLLDLRKKARGGSEIYHSRSEAEKYALAVSPTSSHLHRARSELPASHMSDIRETDPRSHTLTKFIQGGLIHAVLTGNISGRTLQSPGHRLEMV